MKWLKGYIECRLCGGSLERFLNMCRHHGIHIWKLRQTEEIHMCMYAKDYVCQVGSTSASGEEERTSIPDTEDVEKLDILFRFSLFFGYTFCIVILFMGDYL